jgi:hypothetical protein
MTVSATSSLFLRPSALQIDADDVPSVLLLDGGDDYGISHDVMGSGLAGWERRVLKRRRGADQGDMKTPNRQVGGEQAEEGKAMNGSKGGGGVDF